MFGTLVTGFRLPVFPIGTFSIFAVTPPDEESLENAWERTCVASPPCRRLMRRMDTEIIPRALTPPLHLWNRKKPLISIRHNPWLDREAEHSGDEVSDGL